VFKETNDIAEYPCKCYHSDDPCIESLKYFYHFFTLLTINKKNSHFFHFDFYHSDDPYYCGLRARIPNFAKTKIQKDKEAMRMAASQELPVHYGGPGGPGGGGGAAMGMAHPDVWHKPQRGYHDGGMIPGED
jgi:hypothetical protein